MKRMIRMAQYALVAAGILALGYCAIVYFAQWNFQVSESRRFDHNHLKAATLKTPPRNGTVLGRLEIPRIGLTAMVIEGVEDDNLKRAAGHIPGTALPGQAGNIGIGAHRDTLFRPLRHIRKNDLLTLSTPQGAYRYRVVSTHVVAPEDIQVLYPTTNDSLTLVTCFPFDYIGSAPQRFIVRAWQVQE